MAGAGGVEEVLPLNRRPADFDGEGRRGQEKEGEEGQGTALLSPHDLAHY